MLHWLSLTHMAVFLPLAVSLHWPTLTYDAPKALHACVNYAPVNCWAHLLLPNTRQHCSCSISPWCAYPAAPPYVTSQQPLPYRAACPSPAPLPYCRS
jgi:hypothetical protein